MTFIGKTEIPNVGTYLYAEAWAEGQIGGTGSLLSYLYKKDIERYRAIIAKLGLRSTVER